MNSNITKRFDSSLKAKAKKLVFKKSNYKHLYSHSNEQTYRFSCIIYNSPCRVNRSNISVPKDCVFSKSDRMLYCDELTSVSLHLS